MKNLLAKILPRERKAPPTDLTTKPSVLPPSKGPSLRLEENWTRPTVRLFESREAAQERAEELGAPWCAVAFACGYILTNGWSFQDAKGALPAFCPVPPESLPFMQELVTGLKREDVSSSEMAQRIYAELRTIPALLALSRPLFEAACTCTLLRVGYPAPTGAKDDWLTMPAWALRLPSRRKRLAENAAMKGETLELTEGS